tara:strand:- start:288 stop:671 length:384 start_codon:yes stop_codon:yes gene_type:complete
MKMMIRFWVGYLGGILLAVSWLVSRGDGFEAVMRALAAWLPVAAVYCAILAITLSLSKLGRLVGMLELCGLCVALLPLFSGFWPPYYMRWDVALIMIAVQCVALGVAVAVVFFVNRFIGSLRKSDSR